MDAKHWAYHFAEFYRFNPDTGAYDNVLGSDSVAYLDGRFSFQNMKAKAAHIGGLRGFDGYRVCRGTHTRPFYLNAAVQKCDTLTTRARGSEA
jgi:hypothetical protein